MRKQLPGLTLKGDPHLHSLITQGSTAWPLQLVSRFKVELLRLPNDICEKVSHVQVKAECGNTLLPGQQSLRLVCPCELRPDSAPSNDNLP